MSNPEITQPRVVGDSREAPLRARLDQLTKPPGSLGRLEDLAARLGAIQGSPRPETRPRRLVVFAADHGVVASGVTAWPSDVTSLMIDNIVGGGAACSALARAHDVELRLVDVGASGPLRDDGPLLRVARVANGTADLFHGPAMSLEQFDEAWRVGDEEAKRALAEGARVLAAGEMGIGNTTAASCLIALLTGLDVDAAVGRGAGADDATLARKREVVAAATERARAQLAGEASPRAALASVAGFELIAMAGFFAAGAAGGATLVIDGVIATAGALVAEQLAPGSREAMIAAHLSVEPAHRAALDALGLEPFLDWGLRLGEGTGALLLVPLLDSAAAMLREMATFADLGLGGGEDDDQDSDDEGRTPSDGGGQA